MSTIRSVKSSSGGAGVLAIEGEFSPLGRRYFSLAPAVGRCGGDTFRHGRRKLEEGLEVIKQRLASLNLAGVEDSIAEPVLT
jgi:hypothetical protein